MIDEPDGPALSRAVTRELAPGDRGSRTKSVDLALAYDPVTRTFNHYERGQARE